MKLLLLRVLLQRRARDEGFTLPMVIALGLVMILLGMINIVKSGEENINSIAQSQRIDALAVAELGAAQYRQFLDRNRALILQSRSEWTSTTDVCETVSDTTNGWANNDNDGGAASTYDETMWRSISLNEVDLGEDLNDDGDSTDTSVEIGSYKIVDYEFDLDGVTGDTDDDTLFNQTSDDENDRIIPLDGVSDARGILTIKGRTPDDDASEAQIEVEIPVRINTDDLDNLAPALWIDQSSATGLGTLEINNGGNLVITHRIGDGAITWDGSTLQPCEDPTDLTINSKTVTVVSDPRGVPPISDLQDFVNNVDVDGDGTNDGLPGSSNNAFPADPTTLLGQPNTTGHVPYDDGISNNDPIYFYQPVGSLTLTDDLKTDGIADVILYVNGDFTVDNTGTLPSTTTKSVINIGNDDPSNTSTNLQISATGNVEIKTGGQTINIIGLIHVPDGTFTVSGGGTVNITGAVWANDFDVTGATAATVNITPDETDIGGFVFEDSYPYYRVAVDRDPKPITQPPTNWKTEEVTN